MKAIDVREDVQAEMRRHMAAVEQAAASFTTALVATVKMRHRMTASTLSAAVMFDHADAGDHETLAHPECTEVGNRDLHRAWIQMRAHRRLRTIAEKRMRRLVELSGESGNRLNALMATIDGITLASEPTE